MSHPQRSQPTTQSTDNTVNRQRNAARMPMAKRCKSTCFARAARGGVEILAAREPQIEPGETIEQRCQKPKAQVSRAVVKERRATVDIGCFGQVHRHARTWGKAEDWWILVDLDRDQVLLILITPCSQNSSCELVRN